MPVLGLPCNLVATTEELLFPPKYLVSSCLIQALNTSSLPSYLVLVIVLV